MKTLIFNGSPRKNGDCAALIHELVDHLHGEVKIVSSYYDGINACIDCRYCKENVGCSIDDGMQGVYNCIEKYDNVVIASPIYFSELSGSLLGVMSRLQTYFCQRHFRNKPVDIKRKRGVLILTGAEPGTDAKPQSTAKTLFKLMNTEDIALVLAVDTDKTPAKCDEKALQQAREAAMKLNEGYT